MYRKYRLFAAALLGIAFCGNVPAAPEAELWQFWDTYESESRETIDHSAWDRFLATYVKPDSEGVNRVSYREVSGPDKDRLNAYVDELAGAGIRAYNRAEQLAYWINLYNALTVQVVLNHYPVDSIKDIDISPGFFSTGPWGKKLVTVEGKELSLDDIEHRILRPIWQDPRIHYTVNCASIGCPNLARQAYTAANVGTMLARQASDYINHPRGAMTTDGGLTVSSIYDWFVADFGGSERGVLDHLLEYADAGLADAIRSGAEIERYRYDWALNDTPASAAD